MIKNLTFALILSIIMMNVGFAGKWTSLIATQAGVISLGVVTPIPVPTPNPAPLPTPPGPTPIPVPDIGTIKPPTKTLTIRTVQPQQKKACRWCR